MTTITIKKQHFWTTKRVERALKEADTGLNIFSLLSTPHKVFQNKIEISEEMRQVFIEKPHPPHKKRKITRQLVLSELKKAREIANLLCPELTRQEDENEY